MWFVSLKVLQATFCVGVKTKRPLTRNPVCIRETPVKVCEVCPRRQKILGTALYCFTVTSIHFCIQEPFLISLLLLQCTYIIELNYIFKNTKRLQDLHHHMITVCTDFLYIKPLTFYSLVGQKWRKKGNIIYTSNNHGLVKCVRFLFYIQKKNETDFTQEAITNCWAVLHVILILIKFYIT